MWALSPKASMTTITAGCGPPVAGRQMYAGMRPSAVGNESVSVLMSMASPGLHAQELQQIRRQIKKLRTARGAADQRLDSLAQARVHCLSSERRDLALGLRAYALVRKPRGDRVGGGDAAGVEVDLVVDVEAVNVVVHGMEAVEPRARAHEPQDSLADEHARGAGERTIELGDDGRGDLSFLEQGMARLAIREARVGQIDPASRVEVPARPRTTRGHARGRPARPGVERSPPPSARRGARRAAKPPPHPFRP